jgi:hypothetical protein
MNFIRSGEAFTVVLNGTVHTFDRSHGMYDVLVEAIKNGDSAAFEKSINVGKTIETWSKNGFSLIGGVLMYGTEEVAPEIAAIVMQMISEGFNEVPILNFMKKLYENPANHVVVGLYDWLAHRSLAICEDGDFFAYKAVSIYHGEPMTDVAGRQVVEGDLVDSYTKKIRNNVGDKNEMIRRAVNDNRDVACADGYHVGTIAYINDIYKQDKVIICKINPADVVSIPHDSGCQKIRCCKYEVISEMKGQMKIVESVSSLRADAVSSPHDGWSNYHDTPDDDLEDDCDDDDDDLMDEIDECFDEDEENDDGWLFQSGDNCP